MDKDLIEMLARLKKVIDYDIIHAFVKIEELFRNEVIESYSYNGENGVFTITALIGHEDFPDYDKEKRTFELDWEEVLNGDFNKVMEELKQEYYEVCKEAYEEEYGAEKPLLKTYYEDDGTIWTDYL